MSLVDELTSLAFSRGEVTRANEAIDEARAQRGPHALSYEVALPALGPDEFLTGRALPKLLYFLDCRGVKPPASGGVFVSLFTPDGLHFIDAGLAVEKLVHARGLTMAEAVRRYGADGAGDPPMLGA